MNKAERERDSEKLLLDVKRSCYSRIVAHVDSGVMSSFVRMLLLNLSGNKNRSLGGIQTIYNKLSK